jgi:hypothetical protein
MSRQLPGSLASDNFNAISDAISTVDMLAKRRDISNYSRSTLPKARKALKALRKALAWEIVKCES